MIGTIHDAHREAEFRARNINALARVGNDMATGSLRGILVLGMTADQSSTVHFSFAPGTNLATWLGVLDRIRFEILNDMHRDPCIGPMMAERVKHADQL